MTKQKFFLSYRPPKKRTPELEQELEQICTTLKEKNHKVYCSFKDKAYYFDEAGMSAKEVKKHIYSKLEQSNHLLLYVKNNLPSKQMQEDLEKAKKLGHKITLLAPTYQTTKHFIEEVDGPLLYDNIDDLCTRLTWAF